MSPRILLIDPDLDSAERLQRVLTAEGYEVLTSITGQAGLLLARMNRPDLIVVDIDLPDMDGLEVCSLLRSSRSTAKVPILVYTARSETADKVACFKCGVQDYVVKPADLAELVVRIRVAVTSAERVRAKVVVVWGAKGGVGSSTVASNVAVALRSSTQKRITLVDASVMGGTVGVMLNVASRHTLSDLLPRIDSLDLELLSSVLASHATGVRVLLSMPWSRDGQVAQPDQLMFILDWLQEANDYLVVDTSPSLDPTTAAVLRMADLVVTVLTPEMTTLRNARLFLRIFESWGQPKEKLLLVLNRSALKGGIKKADVQSALQRSIDTEIPNDEPLVTYSINRGIPLVISHKRSPIGHSLLQLANTIVSRTQVAK